MYEYFLDQFASAEGKKGGEFYTPACIVELLVKMIGPYEGRVFDPCCRSGGICLYNLKNLDNHLKIPNNTFKYDLSLCILLKSPVWLFGVMPGFLFFSQNL